MSAGKNRETLRNSLRNKKKNVFLDFDFSGYDLKKDGEYFDEFGTDSHP